jgi:hypothetical protein
LDDFSRIFGALKKSWGFKALNFQKIIFLSSFKNYENLI